ncbi:methyltransferase, partial [mine drainage metagenome]
NGRINRFTIYSADLSKCERSAVVLPAARRIEGTADELSYDHAEKPGRFLVMPDPALLMAKLVNSSFDPSVFKVFEKDERRLVLTSDIMPKDPETCESFELISFSSASGIRDELESLKPGKVVPRFSLDPDQYYEYARSLVDPLWVGESVYLFKNGDSIALARKIN